MPVHTLDLGHCSFRRTKAQIQAVAKATASYSSRFPCSASDSSSPPVHSDPLCWFSSCPNLHICLSITLDHDLCFAVGKGSLVEQTLIRSLEQAQLWSQLGLRAHLTAVEWSSTSIASKLALHLSTVSSYTPSGASNCDYDASSVQPPTIIAVHRFNAVHVSIDISRTTLDVDALGATRNVNTTHQIPSSAIDFIRVRNDGGNMAPANHTFECFGRPQTDIVTQRATRTSQSDCKIILSLVDACFRKFICSDSRETRGLSLVQDSHLMDLAGLAPSIFKPGHGQQLSRRAHLIQPIAKFLSAFGSHDAASPLSQDCARSYDSSIELGGQDANHDTPLTREVIAGHLWVLMSNVLAAKKSARGLKPLSFDGYQTKVGQDSPDSLDDILDDHIPKEDRKFGSLIDSDTRDVSLFDTYSVHLPRIPRMDEHKPSEPNSFETQGSPNRAGEAITGDFEPFEEILSPSDCSLMGIRLQAPGGNTGFSKEREHDYDMLKGTTFLLDGRSCAFLGRHKTTEAQGSGEPMTEWEELSPASSSSMIMVDYNNKEFGSKTRTDDSLRNIVDAQDLSFGNGPPLSNTEDDRLPGNTAGNSSGRPNVLEVSCNRRSALLTEPEDAYGHDESMMTSSIDYSMIHGIAWTSDITTPSWEMDYDQDMIQDIDQVYRETKEDSDSFML